MSFCRELTLEEATRRYIRQNGL